LIEKLLERLDEVVQPKQKLKESAEDKFVPSPAIFAILMLVADKLRCYKSRCLIEEPMLPVSSNASKCSVRLLVRYGTFALPHQGTEDSICSDVPRCSVR